MERAATIEQLNNLLAKLQNLHEIEVELTQAKRKLEKVETHFEGKLAVFDREHKEKFITQRISSAPTAPKGIVKLAFPVYLSKKAKYQKEQAIYEGRLARILDDYMKVYSAERAELETADKANYDAAKLQASDYVSSIQAKYSEVYSSVKADTTISERFKNIGDLKEILSFFEDGRVDTLKEAVNLWFDERRKDEEAQREAEHRQEMLRMEEERLKMEAKRLEAAEAAEEYERLQYVEAQLTRAAAERAEEAARSAQYQN